MCSLAQFMNPCDNTMMINELPGDFPIPATGPIDATPIAVASPVRHDLDWLWRAVIPELRARMNDVHIPICMAYAERLCAAYPEADDEVVRVAILLHDTGWARVDQDRILSEAFSEGGMQSAIRYQHELESCTIAREVLPRGGYGQAFIEEVTGIVEGHDTRAEPRSLEDALVKDADRLWRFDRVGTAIGAMWFGIAPSEYVDRLQDELPLLNTEAGLMMGRADLDRTKALYLTDIIC